MRGRHGMRVMRAAESGPARALTVFSLPLSLSPRLSHASRMPYIHTQTRLCRCIDATYLAVLSNIYYARPLSCIRHGGDAGARSGPDLCPLCAPSRSKRLVARRSFQNPRVFSLNRERERGNSFRTGYIRASTTLIPPGGLRSA